MPDDDFESDFLQALGTLLVQANMLEEALVDLYWISTGIEEVALIKLVRTHTLGQLKARVLKDCRDPLSQIGLADLLDHVAMRLDPAVEQRNAFVHATWSFGPGYVERSRWPRTGPVRGELRKLSVVDVAAAVETIGHAAQAVYDLYDSAVERLPPGYVKGRAGEARAREPDARNRSATVRARCATHACATARQRLHLPRHERVTDATAHAPR